MGCDAHAAVRGGEGAGGRRPTAGAAQGRRQRQHKARCRLPAPSCAAGRPLALLPCGPWWAALLLRPAPVCCHLDKAFSARRRQQQWPTVSRPLILNPLSRSIVCSQKPQQENSCRQIWLGNDPAPANCRGWVDRLSGCGRLTVGMAAAAGRGRRLEKVPTLKHVISTRGGRGESAPVVMIELPSAAQRSSESQTLCCQQAVCSGEISFLRKVGNRCHPPWCREDGG
jgi:hypothetical protein